MSDSLPKPHFYLHVSNGMSMSFGIIVYLGDDRSFPLFSQYTSGENYDNRKDLFTSFVNAENAGLLTFSFDIFHDDRYIGMRWLGETSTGPNISRGDCRNWIWNLNGMRIRLRRGDGGTGGAVITDYKVAQNPPYSNRVAFPEIVDKKS